MIKLNEVKIVSTIGDNRITSAAAKMLEIDKSDIVSCKILKKSIDCRKKPLIYYTYTLSVCVKNEDKIDKVYSRFEESESDYNFDTTKRETDKKVVVIGLGPAGLFCAYRLALAGIKPIVIERGKNVEERSKDVEKLLSGAELNEESNILFGEGGAGTFSDGKLNTGISSPEIKKILRTFVNHGAPDEIEYMAKPHVGSDKLPRVISSIRKEMESLGATILFEHKFINFTTCDGKIDTIIAKNKDEIVNIPCDYAVLAIGHSARDTFKLLQEKEVLLTPKPFSMGIRIEQSREVINQSQYGVNYDKTLPAADYKLATHLDSKRSVYTFCMCPGGVIIPAFNEKETMNVNGMSYFARDEQNSNSALLVNVNIEDYFDGNDLSGMYFQEKWERTAYKLANPNGGTLNAPCQTVGEFLNQKNEGKILNPSYRPNVTFCDLNKCLPEFVSRSLKVALIEFNQKIKNFASSNALLTGIETRSSSPIRVLRKENYESESLSHFYPCGEGCGYAGGIISACVDGLKIAEQILKEI